jgi:hypothetical protein
MSARPGLCGGHWVTGVPTAITLTGTGRPSRIGYAMGISHSLNFNLNSCVLLIAFIFVIVEQIREMAKTTCALYCTWRITISAGLAKAFT